MQISQFLILYGFTPLCLTKKGAKSFKKPNKQKVFVHFGPLADQYRNDGRLTAIFREREGWSSI